MSSSFYAPTLNLFIKLANFYHIDPLPLLLEAEIDPALSHDFNARIPSQKVYDFHQKLILIIDDDNFGLKAGQCWHPTQLGALGYAWMTSSTLRSAFNRLVRFAQAVLGSVSVSVEESDQGISLLFDFSQEPFAPASRLDANRSIILAMIQCNAGQDFHPLSVSFSHAKPENVTDFEMLFQCPVHFNADIDSITISHEEADKPRSCSNTQLAQLHDQLLIDYLAKLDKNNIVERVKIAIINELGTGSLSDKSVAKTMNLSSRTLQRRLEEKNTSFKSLVNEIRQDLADTYLHDSSLSLTEISFMLGFSEMSAFSRAYKRWTNSSPSAFRDAK